MERLVTHGLDRSEVHDLRARFVPPLVLYNFAVPLWEWVHLGLFDLLEAVHPLCAYPDDAGTRRLRHGLEIPDPPFTTDDEYPRIYWEAMRIALLADT
ncbi:MAG: hypothetical protein IT198_08570 [Acidimicrobiia bacterium]|nr:hypothetical protein [Acidimicrobiia bacterium]